MYACMCYSGRGFEAEVIDSRCQSFNAYLKAVLMLPEVASSIDVLSFIGAVHDETDRMLLHFFTIVLLSQ
jgi:hypothetical protein